MKISVIVPVHGVEKYLFRCLDSLAKQDFSDVYEVLCINDTPNDNSPKIIDEFVTLKTSIFKRIDVFHGNVSFSRNDGLRLAKGEYIVFVDGDDFVDENFLTKLYEEAKHTDSDIVVSNYYAYKTRKKIIFTSNFAAEGVYNNTKALKKLFNDISCRGYVWGKLFKKSLLLDNQLEFMDVNQVSEDVLFTYMAFLNAKKISFIRDRLYYYVLRDNSITTTRNKFNAAQMVINSFALMKLYSIKIKGDDNSYFNFNALPKKFLVKYYLFGNKSKKYTKKEINKSVKTQFNIIVKNILIEGMPWEKVAKSSGLFNDIKISNNEKNVDIIDISKA